MQRTVNRISEMEIVNSECVVMTPYAKLPETVSLESFKKSYVTKVSQLLESNNVLFSNDITSNDNFISMPFNLSHYIMYLKIRDFGWSLQLKLFKQLVAIATLGESTNTVFLWENENFFIHLAEEKVVTLLFQFNEYPVMNKLSNVAGLRKMIFNALTILDYTSGKPVRSDFIDQSDRTIVFANKLLLAQTIEQVEQIICEEIEQEKKREAEGDTTKKRGLFRKKKMIVEESYQQQLKKALLESKSSTPGKVTKRNQSMLKRLTDWVFSPTGAISTTVFLLVFSVLTLYVAPKWLAYSSKEGAHTVEKKTVDKVLTAYRYYIKEDKNKAYAMLDSIGYSNLPTKNDKEILLNFYYEQKKYTKAMKVNPNSVYDIGDILVSSDNENELLTLETATKNKVLSFDLACRNKEYQAIVQLFPMIEVYNTRRINEVVRAFYLTNQREELESWIQSYTKTNEATKDKRIMTTIQNFSEICSAFATHYNSYKRLETEYNQIKKDKDKLVVQLKKDEMDQAYKELVEMTIDPVGVSEDLSDGY